MTALDQVLAAEQEAEEVITKAKDEAGAVVASARAAQSEALQKERARLSEDERTSLESFENEVAGEVEKLQKNTSTGVAEVKEKFSSQQNAAVDSVIAEL